MLFRERENSNGKVEMEFTPFRSSNLVDAKDSDYLPAKYLVVYKDTKGKIKERGFYTDFNSAEDSYISTCSKKLSELPLRLVPGKTKLVNSHIEHCNISEDKKIKESLVRPEKFVPSSLEEK